MDKAKAQELVTHIMETCDTDKSGKIDYNGEFNIKSLKYCFFLWEFLMATLNKEKMLSKEKLDQAFKLFDEVFHKFWGFLTIFWWILGWKWVYFLQWIQISLLWRWQDPIGPLGRNGQGYWWKRRREGNFLFVDLLCILR